MPKFLYVQAIVRRAALTTEGSGAISFRHVAVEATSEDDAYSVGAEQLDRAGYSPQTRTVNDYVVALP